MKKLPKQERSRQIVDAVLNGATRILSKMRLKEVSTNKIAEVAGVGIGSLYDYFPNKNAIVKTLIDRRVDGVVADFRNLLLQDSDKSLEEKIEDVVSFLEVDFLNRKDFLREIFLLAPEASRMEALYRARVEITGLISAYLQQKRPALSPTLLDQKSFLVVHGTLGVVESYIMVNPSFFSSTEIVTEIRKAIRFILLNDQ